MVICAICASLAIIFSFIEADLSLPGSIRLGVAQFVMPVVVGWLAVFPRSIKELDELVHGHPIAQRFFGGKPGGFFGDCRRKLTPFGKGVLFGCIGFFGFMLVLGIVRFELIIIGFLYLVAFCSWIMRLELGGDRAAHIIRQIATELVYQPRPHHGP